MELFKLFGTIGIKNSEAIKGIDDTVNHAKGAAGSLNSAAGGISSKLAVIGKAALVTAAAVGTAFVGLTKSSVQHYADYEQLVGGVETLFGAGGKSIEEYAASVNKSVSDIKSEYDSLMQSQQTVIDNAANAYKTAGMSANEYMSTVTSFSASLLQGLGGDTQKAAEYADRAVTDMSDNANKFGTNIKSIQDAYQGFAKQNYTMLDNLKLGYGGTKTEMERLVKEASKLKDVQKELGVTVDENSLSFDNIVNAIHVVQTEMGIAGTTSLEAATTIQGSVSSMKAAWDNWITGMADSEQDIQQLTDNLVESAGIAAENIFNRIKIAVPRLLAGLGIVITQGLQQLCNSITDALGLSRVSISEIFDSIGLAFQALWVFCQVLWETIGRPIWDMIQSALETVSSVFSAKMPEISNFVSNCFTDIKSFWEGHLKPCFEAIGNFIQNVLAPIFDSVFNSYITSVVDTAFTFIKNLWEGTLKPVLTGITDFLTGVFTGNWELAWSGIKSIAEGLINGIVTAIEGMINSAIDGVNALIGAVNGALDLLNGLTGLDWNIPTLNHLDGLGGNKTQSTSNKPTTAAGIVKNNKQIASSKRMTALATGMDFVPYDEFPATLHKGEMVLPAGQADYIRSGALAKSNEQIVSVLNQILGALEHQDMSININNREFGRLVKGVT